MRSYDLLGLGGFKFEEELNTEGSEKRTFKYLN